jgi:DNA primase
MEKIEGLKVPCGITLPWYADGAIWGIKVRRAAGEQRYQQVSGGNIRGCLYLADRIVPGPPLLITEGEIDALTAWQTGWGKLSAASIGSASNWRIHARWYGKLLIASRILICTDSDAAGAEAAQHLATISRAVRLMHIPVGKDLNEFYLHDGHDGVLAWLSQTLDA